MSMIIKDFDLEDIYSLSEILDKMNITVKTEKLTGKIKTDKLENMDDVKEIGKEAIIALVVDLASDVIKNLWKAKNLVNKFIGNMTGMRPEDVKKMGIKDLKAFFSELATQPDFQSFLESPGE
jgi:acyl-[acyl carrier protein]--UDP-N-acetylglucosamine O-acyltransferase